MGTVTEWLFTKALKKAVLKIVQLIVAWIGAKGIEKYGITVDWAQFTTTVTALLFGLLEILRNWLKVKIGWSWL